MKRAMQMQHKKRARLRKTSKRHGNTHKRANQHAVSDFPFGRTLRGYDGTSRVVVSTPSEELQEGSGQRREDGLD